MIVIGITGTLGAGKGTVVEYLTRKKGFEHFSVRGFLAEVIKNKGEEVNRDTLTHTANALRKENSPSYIIEQLYNQAIQSGRNCVIESIRTPGEIANLRKQKGFVLLAVNARLEVRFERIQKRNSETDRIDFETFRKNEEREMHSEDPSKQNLSACIKEADFILQNNGSIDGLHAQVEKILADIEARPAQIELKEGQSSSKYVRPSWDEYFMEIAHTVSKRATCDRGRSGCVIARGRQILVTGYVGSPIGLPHCDDVGHQMKKMLHEDGRITMHCVRTVHAEQNAISQAARLGISIDGATLYCRMTPCRVCAMLIINCGIKRVVCEKKYHAGEESEVMFRDAGVELEYFNQEFVKYDNQ